MPLLVSSKFDEDPMKKMKALCSGQHFPHHKSMGEIFNAQGAGNSKPNNPISPKFKLRRDVMPVLIICKFDEDPIKNEDSIDRTTFSSL